MILALTIFCIAQQKFWWEKMANLVNQYQFNQILFTKFGQSAVNNIHQILISLNFVSYGIKIEGLLLGKSLQYCIKSFLSSYDRED